MKANSFVEENNILQNIQQLNIDLNNPITFEELTNYGRIIELSKNQNNSELTPGTEISKWKEPEILKWSNQAKSRLNFNKDTHLIEVLAIISKAVQIQSKQTLRDIQMISILFLLCKQNTCGRLLQILTGEGKSLTISCLAIIKCLQGNLIDIVTSSDVLAKRDSQEKQSFYSLFGLQCSHNIKEENKMDQSDNTKSCYQDNISILYGTAHSFQADILQHEFYHRKTRGNRKFDFLIVDEVDSMLVDSRGHRTLLSSAQAGFQKILTIFERIWIELQIFSPLLTTDTHMLKQTDPDTLETYEEDVSAHLVRTIDNFINGNEGIGGYGKSIPKYMLEYINYKLAVWVVNAVKAKFKYNINKQYIVKNNKIFPVDYENTGVTQINTQYSDGIHQFLELKENLPLTNPNLITNYSSNVNFFRRYKSNLCGVTGTLGSKHIHQFLSETYFVDFIYIPPFKNRQLIEIPSAICFNRDHWIQKIISEAYQVSVKSKRCCLIICQTIYDVEELKLFFEIKFDPNKVFAYTDSSNEEQEKQIQNFAYQGHVIISTNLAGRGTDIKISEDIERNGGLHVILTFLPVNSRVQEQAFGRAGRMGQKGSAIMFFYVEVKDDKNIQKIEQLDSKIQKEFENFKDGADEMQQLNLAIMISNREEINKQILFNWKDQRNIQEKFQMTIAKEQIKEVIELDNLFSKFCNLIQQLKISQKDDYTMFSALEFRFGLFLDLISEKYKNDKEQINFNDSKKDIDDFFNQIKQDFQNGCLIIRPEDMLKKGSISLIKEDFQKANSEIDKSQQIDSENPLPHYNRILCQVKEKKYDKVQNEFQQFQEKLKNKRIQCEMISNTLKISNQLQLSNIERSLDQEKIILKSMKDNFENQSKNVQFIQNNQDNHQNEIQQENIIPNHLGQFKLNTNQTQIQQIKPSQFQGIQSNIQNIELKEHKNFISSLQNRVHQIQNIDFIPQQQLSEQQIQSGKEKLNFNLNQNNKILQPQNPIINQELTRINNQNLISQNEIRSQELRVGHLEQQLMRAKKQNINIEMNIKKDLKDIQILESLQKQMLTNIQTLHSLVGKKDEEPVVEFESSSNLKPYMQNHEVFKDLDELQRQLDQEGLPYIGNIQAKKIERNWFGSILVIALGVVQVVAGIAISCFSAGAATPFGLGLIIEGATDIFKGVKALIKGEEINLQDYFKEKAVSLTLTCMLAGQQAMTEVGQLFKQGFTYAGQNGILSAAGNLLSKEVIFTGLQKAGQKFLEQEGLKMMASQPLTNVIFSDKKNENNNIQQQQEQEIQFRKKLKEIKENSQLSQEILKINDKEEQCKKNLDLIYDKIGKFVGEQFQTKYKQTISKISFLQTSNSDNQIRVQNLINLGYNNIDKTKKDQIFEKISNILCDSIFKIDESVDQIIPQIQELLQQIFNNINSYPEYSVISSSINAFGDELFTKSLNLCLNKKQKEIEEKQQNFKNNIDKEKNKLQSEKTKINQNEKQLKDKNSQLDEDHNRILQEENSLTQLQKNLNYYNENDVNNYNQKVNQFNQLNQQYNAKGDQIKQQNQQLKSQIDDYNQSVNKIKQQADQYNNLIQIEYQILEQFQKKLEALNKQENKIANLQQIFRELSIFDEDNITLNSSFQSRMQQLKTKIQQKFNIEGLADNIVECLKSKEFNQEQTQLIDARGDLINSLVVKTNQKIIKPFLQQALNRLLQDDIKRFNQNIQNIVKQIDK